MSDAQLGRKGKIVQILGAVIDVEFSKEVGIPAIYDALVATNPAIDDKENNLTFEVAQHLGDNRVRCIAMDSTEGLVRGQDVIDTGAPISIPVGEKTLGRIMDVIGRPVDEAGPIDAEVRWPIHREAPTFEEQSTSK
ncbi:MAG: F0F1 ATP synthase subunit beta, partial [Bdellovibrionales bacterium]|nr:F0F1 ATP synthase subunit beta [Bdellovibrionales bacterium]